MLQDDVLENSTQKIAAKKTKLSSGTTVNTLRPSKTRLGDQNSFFVSSPNNNLLFLSVLYGCSLYIGQDAAQIERNVNQIWRQLTLLIVVPAALIRSHTLYELMIISSWCGWKLLHIGHWNHISLYDIVVVIFGFLGMLNRIFIPIQTQNAPPLNIEEAEIIVLKFLICTIFKIAKFSNS